MPETSPLAAIQRILSAYRSERAHITEEEITTAWAEFDALRAERRNRMRISDRWPTLQQWSDGHAVASPALVVELRDALAYFGGGDAT